MKGKKNRKDMQEFEFNLMDNIISLHDDLSTKTYRHGSYQFFKICDPKPRNIHKASVRDRLLHHAVYRVLYPFFDRTFIPDSFSCRINRGTHKAINRFRDFAYEISKNNTKTAWVLKCDIKKFFASIDQTILLEIIKGFVSDKDIIWLVGQIIGSFYSVEIGKGLPLGNLTSQLLVNIYMNKFDHFVKHKLKVKYYIRYADDFVIFSENRIWLEKQILQIKEFLWRKLCLELHPQKLYIKTLASGIDFLGWVHFPDHRVLRATTKRRMMKRMAETKEFNALNSYLGLLSHGNTYKLRTELLNLFDENF